MTLPAEGRVGPAPEWPLPPSSMETTAGEVELPTPWMRAHWTAIWALPQAVMWEQRQLVVQVAAYCVALADSLQPGAPANTRTVVLRMEEELGISESGMARHRWRVAADEVAEQRERASVVPSSQAEGSAGARLKALS